MNLRPVWSRSTEAQLSGLALAREAGLVLAWDVGQRLHLWDLKGRLQAQTTLLWPAAAAAISDDGGLVVAAGPDGSVWWLNRRLELLFDSRIVGQPVALALEPLGHRLLLSDRQRKVYLLDNLGNELVVLTTPRPLHHLAFVPTRLCILGAADLGLVSSHDGAGNLLWRDAPFTHLGSLASDGSGERILAAGYSEGILLYHWSKGRQGQIRTGEPCRLACTSFDGEVILAAGASASLSLLKSDGRVIGSVALPAPASAVALGALGDVAVFGTPDGQVNLVALGE